MEELNLKTKVFTDENQFTLICHETNDFHTITKKRLWDVYLIFNKTRDCTFMGGYEEDDLPVLDKIGNNVLYWYENDLLLTILDKYV